MNQYEQKKQSRIDRLKNRIARLEKFAEGKDLSMFGESRSGIPLGQPILVGHHSERRHRRHLERIERIVRAGYDASKKAEQLRSRLYSIENNSSIQVDNPDARELIQSKIDKLQKIVDSSKLFNKYIRQVMKVDESLRVAELARLINESPYKPTKYNAEDWASQLLTPDCFGNLGIASFTLTNKNAEIRRLKSRLIELDRIEQNAASFETIYLNGCRIELNDGQWQVFFDSIPSEEIRNKLKSYPISLKWSRYSMAWVRKQTGSTGGNWLNNLKKVLE